MSESYAYKCCRLAGIKSVSKHYKYKKPGESRTYPNLLLAGINIDGPSQCIVSDMTAFYVKNTYYELTIYMDLWNNEIVAHALSSRRGDRMTYINGLHDYLEFTKKFPGVKHILHSDDQYMHQRISTSCSRRITSHDPCPEQERQRIMQPWNPLMDG